MSSYSMSILEHFDKQRITIICIILLRCYLVNPFTLDFQYNYGESIGAETFLTVNDFITFVLQFILGFGIAPQLPIIMYVLLLAAQLIQNSGKKTLDMQS